MRTTDKATAAPWDNGIALARIDAAMQGVFDRLEALGRKPLIEPKALLLGCHGTSLQNYESIRATGWRPSKSTSRVGPGVYFYEGSEKTDGVKYATCWAATEPGGRNFVDPCVMVCKVANVRVLDMLARENFLYFKDLRERFIDAVFGLMEQLACEYGKIPIDFSSAVRENLSRFREHFLGRQVNIRAPWRDQVDVIRIFFRLDALGIENVPGFIVARKLEAIKIEKCIRCK